jgi:tRNA(Arg) A34 adenosine deaminase TadA
MKNPTESREALNEVGCGAACCLNDSFPELFGNHRAACPDRDTILTPSIRDYVAHHGNRSWDEAILYTTGEPCPMCMSAMVWAGMGGVVWGTSIEQLRQFGINQIMIPASTLIGASAFYHGEILGHVLQAETDALFQNRKPS